jgi:hypothetical protein
VFEAPSIHSKEDGSAPQGIVSRTPQHIGIGRCHSSLKSCHENLDCPGRDCIDILQVSPQEKNPSQVDPATEEAMQSALDVQFTFLDM